eukprot:gb/GEZN01009211.1/.p1 GENE.gb/GEZN01009211.1/~~gb/GEZN01009211.1/.p1  ORF type:complete len:434 (+),score=12.00 gb/GEZN01009211.1/:56-1303(+)
MVSGSLALLLITRQHIMYRRCELNTQEQPRSSFEIYLRPRIIFSALCHISLGIMLLFWMLYVKTLSVDSLSGFVFVCVYQLAESLGGFIFVDITLTFVLLLYKALNPSSAVTRRSTLWKIHRVTIGLAGFSFALAWIATVLTMKVWLAFICRFLPLIYLAAPVMAVNLMYYEVARMEAIDSQHKCTLFFYRNVWSFMYSVALFLRGKEVSDAWYLMSSDYLEVINPQKEILVFLSGLTVLSVFVYISYSYLQRSERQDPSHIFHVAELKLAEKRLEQRRKQKQVHAIQVELGIGNRFELGVRSFSWQLTKLSRNIDSEEEQLSFVVLAAGDTIGLPRLEETQRRPDQKYDVCLGMKNTGSDCDVLRIHTQRGGEMICAREGVENDLLISKISELDHENLPSMVQVEDPRCSEIST